MTGSCEPDQAPDDFCDALLPGAACLGGRCEKSCEDANGNPDDSMCGSVGVVGGQCVLPTEGDGCSPQNNGCYATKALEMWDPSCEEWTTRGEQARPRMYHSTALLIPDGRVISMGGGHSDFAWLQVPEEPNAEYFEPTYTNVPGAARPEVSAPDEMLYNSSIEVTVENGIPVSRATIVRLGSTTHGFDMSQRFIELPPPLGEGGVYTVMAPADEEFEGGWTHQAENIAPPGHYMLFLFSDDGMPSVGHYIKVRGPALQELNCEVAPALQADETSCSQEPVGGVCPAGAEVHRQLSFPTVELGSKSFRGFQVYASSNVMHDIANPRPQELEAVHGLCGRACAEHFADVPGASVNCAAVGAFRTPEGHAEGEWNCPEKVET